MPYRTYEGEIMKLKEYIAKLEVLLAKHGDVDVIYASDSEGNSYEKCRYEPSACKFTDGDTDELVKFVNNYPKVKVNAVCIN